MTMKPGSAKSNAQFSYSLAESIENAFKMEWLALKGEALPDTGQDDRRFLFAAIAQGLLDYLKEHESDFIAISTGTYPPPVIRIQAPWLKLDPSTGNSATNVKVEGHYFDPNKKVTVTWDNPAKTVLTPKAGSDGKFTATFKPPPKAKGGRHLVEARDQVGHVAVEAFTLNK